MAPIRMLLLVFLGLFSVNGAAHSMQNQKTVNFDAVLENTLTGYIEPGYLRLLETSAALEGKVDFLCKGAHPTHYTDMVIAYRNLVIAFGPMEWFRVGPIMTNNRLERILFFPDRKSTGLKQVRRALRGQDKSVLSATTLAQKSVAMQGLGALDYLFFGKGFEELTITKNTFRCRYALAVTTNIRQMSAKIYQTWSADHSLREYWLHPSKQNPFFRSDREAMNLILGTLIHGLEATRDITIGSFLHQEQNHDRPKSAPLWRSSVTIFLLESELRGLETLFNKSGIETQLPPEGAHLGNTIRFEFEQAIDTARKLPFSISKLLSNEQTRARLTYLKLAIKYIIQRLNDEFAPATGLAAGFSFGDGD